MLKLFQNQGKVLRWTMGIILFLVAGSMIITLVPNVFGPAGPGAADILAEVDGVPVTTGDVEVELRQHRANNVPPAAISMIASNTIDALIAERVLFAEAAELGLVPTDEELAVWIREQLPDVLFPDGKYIGADAYHRFVRQQFRRTVPEFEQEILYNIAISQHLRQLVTDGVSVTEDELTRRFHEENDSIRIEWAGVDAAGVRGEVEAQPEQLRAYFDANKLRYRHAERRPLKLMMIGPDAAVSEHEIQDAEIDLHYSQNQYRFENPERVKVRHILFMTMGKSDAEAEQAREDAEAVLEELRNGAAGLIPGVGFNEIFLSAWDKWKRGETEAAEAIIKLGAPLTKAVSGKGHEYSLHMRKRLMKRHGSIRHATVRRPTVKFDECDLPAFFAIVDSLELRVNQPPP